MRFNKQRFIFIILIIVTLLIVVVNYFYVPGPPPLPANCLFPTGIDCTDHMVEMNRTILIIHNGMGKDLILKKLVVTETSSSPLYICEMTSGEIAIPNRESATIIADKCTIASVTVGTKYRYDIDLVLQYVGSEEEQTIIGELFAIVED